MQNASEPSDLSAPAVYIVMRWPTLASTYEHKFEKPVFSTSDANAIEELRIFFSTLIGTKDYSSDDLVMMKGPNQAVVFEGKIADLNR